MFALIAGVIGVKGVSQGQKGADMSCCCNWEDVVNFKALCSPPLPLFSYEEAELTGESVRRAQATVPKFFPVTTGASSRLKGN